MVATCTIYTDMKTFFKKKKALFLNRLSDFEIISQRLVPPYNKRS